MNARKTASAQHQATVEKAKIRSIRWRSIFKSILTIVGCLEEAEKTETDDMNRNEGEKIELRAVAKISRVCVVANGSPEPPAGKVAVGLYTCQALVPEDLS